MAEGQYVDSYGGEDRFLPTDQDWRDILNKAEESFPTWASKILDYLFVDRGEPVSGKDLADMIEVEYLGARIEHLNRLLRPFSLALRIASEGNYGDYALYFLPHPRSRGKKSSEDGDE